MLTFGAPYLALSDLQACAPFAMFFSNYIFNKKGPLGKVWLAAHWDSRMSKSMILSTDVSQSAGKANLCCASV